MLIFKRSLGILQSLFTVIPPEYESLCNCWSKHQAQELFPRTKPFSLGHDVQKHRQQTEPGDTSKLQAS